jgi:hypothetical protein
MGSSNLGKEKHEQKRPRADAIKEVNEKEKMK